MNKRIILAISFSGIVLSASLLVACKNCVCSNKNQIIGANPETRTPKYLSGVEVENGLKQGDIRVMVEGGNVNGFTVIPAGTKKFMESQTPGAKKITYKIGNEVYETQKYEKPVIIKIKGQTYNIKFMGKTVDKGTWTALEEVEKVDQKADLIKK